METITIILEEPMYHMGKLLQPGEEMTFTKADYEKNKEHFKHKIKEPVKNVKNIPA